MTQPTTVTPTQEPQLAIYLDHGEGFILTHYLNAGRYGNVVFQFRSVSQASKCPLVACKLLPELTEEEGGPSEIPPDVRLPGKQHPTLVSVQGTAKFSSQTYMVLTEYCNGGDLEDFEKDWLKRYCANPDEFKFFLPEILFWTLVSDLVLALRVLHCDSDPQISHCDISERNVFLQHPLSTDKDTHALLPRFVLGDFGEAYSRDHVILGEKAMNEDFLSNLRWDVASLCPLLANVVRVDDYDLQILMDTEGFGGITDQDWLKAHYHPLQVLKFLQRIEELAYGDFWKTGEFDFCISPPVSDLEFDSRINSLRTIYDDLIETATKRRSELLSDETVRRDLTRIASTRPQLSSRTFTFTVQDFHNLFTAIKDYLNRPSPNKQSWASYVNGLSSNEQPMPSGLWFFLDTLIMDDSPTRLVYIDPATSNVMEGVDFTKFDSRHGASILPPELANGKETFGGWMQSVRVALKQKAMNPGKESGGH